VNFTATKQSPPTPSSDSPPPWEQFRELAERLRERDQQLWDDQLDSDSQSGQLDFLFKEADQGPATESLLKWPEEK
jgi:hypothetical protein